MKMRIGFVSNSSTTSFCIWGTEIDQDEQEIFRKLEKDSFDLELHRGEFSGIYVGKSFTRIGDEETGLQFKKKIRADFKTIFNRDAKFGVIEEAWYDG